MGTAKHDFSKFKYGGECPSRLIRVLVYRHSRPEFEDGSALSELLLVELQAALLLPSQAMRILGVYRAGQHAVAVDIALLGETSGLEAFYSAKLASYVKAIDGLEYALLRGAEVQLLTSTSLNLEQPKKAEKRVDFDLPHRVAQPKPRVNTRLQVDGISGTCAEVGSFRDYLDLTAWAPSGTQTIKSAFDGHVDPLNPGCYSRPTKPEEVLELYTGKVRLNDETESLLRQAERLHSKRYRKNAYLEILELNFAERAATQKIQKAWSLYKAERRDWAARLVQVRYMYSVKKRARLQRRNTRCVEQIQRWWRRTRARIFFIRHKHQLQCIVRIQRAWRRHYTKRMRRARQRLWFITWLRIQARRLKIRTFTRLAREKKLHELFRQDHEQSLHEQAQKDLDAHVRLVQDALRARMEADRMFQEVRAARKAQALARANELSAEAAMAKAQSQEAEFYANSGGFFFSPQLKGANVTISDDAMYAEQVEGKTDKGVVFSAVPARMRKEGVYFEVSIEVVDEGLEDGLVMGYTTALPSPDEAANFDTAFDVPSSWTVGYDGMAHTLGHEDVSLKFNPKVLRIGDRVGLLATPSGYLQLFLNGNMVANVECKVPIERDLFAIVDLLGNTSGVSIVPKARPPKLDTSDIAVVTKLDDGDGAAAAAPEPAPSSPKQDFVGAKAKDRLSGFHKALAGNHFEAGLELSEDRFVATHTRPENMYGVVFGDGPMPEFPEGVYFEVTVDRTTQGHEDGLTLGITLKLPGAHLRFEGADEVAESWSFGYDGQAYASSAADFMPIGWRPGDLRVGDRVGLLVTPEGSGYIILNDAVVVSDMKGMPTQRPLYPFVHLLGNTLSVMLNKDAPPPPLRFGDGVAHGTHGRRVMTAFSMNSAGVYVELTPSGLQVAYTGAPGGAADLGYGVVLGNGPIQSFGEDLYFEVSIDDVRPGEEDGLAIGVTTTQPPVGSEQRTYEHADLVPNSLVIGFDGSVFRSSRQAFEPCDWNAKDLQRGDHVGFLVRDGRASVLVNNRKVASAEDRILGMRPLFAVVDLMGATVGLTLVPGVSPPSIAAIVEAGRLPPQGSTQSATQRPPSPTPRPPSPLERPPQRPPSPTQRPPSPTAQPNPTPDRWPEAQQQASKKTLGKWSPWLHSDQVEISEDGVTATHVDGTGAALHGVVFGDAPVPSFAAGAYFQVKIAGQRRGHDDGLTLGVARRLPAPEEAAAFETADAVPHSWSIGFDGQWLAADEGMAPIRWSPAKLALGDHVGLLVTDSGQFRVIVNGRLVVTAQASTLGPGDLYAFVDLLGNCSAVALEPGARPPEGASGPPAAPASPPSSPRPAASAEDGVMTGWSTELAAPDAVIVSKDGLRAERADPSGQMDFAVVFGNGEVPTYPEGRYYEVVMQEVGGSVQDEGIAVGFTLTTPEQLLDMQRFKVADEVPESFTAGYTGLVFGRGHARAVAWEPAGLRPGSRIGVLFTPHGELMIFENGERVVYMPTGLGPSAASRPIFAVVDLLGSAQKVAFDPRAAAPLPSAARVRTPFQWDANILSPLVRVSANGLNATHSDDTGDALGGVVFGDAELPRLRSGAKYFEVKILATRQGHDDGIVLGVTAQRPTPPAVEIADEVPEAWSLGYGGHSKVPGATEMQVVDWNPKDLQNGDRVGLLVTPEGDVWLLANGEPKASAPVRADPSTSVYPFIDLLGNCKAAAIVPDAAPPQELMFDPSAAPGADAEDEQQDGIANWLFTAW